VSTRDWDQFPIRLPDGVRDEIKQAAKANRRSMNAEILSRIAAPVEGALSLRDWLAGMVLVRESGEHTPDDAAAWAYRYADAMLKARSAP